MTHKLIQDSDQGPLFVGYLDTPTIDRRFLLGLGIAGFGISGGLGGMMAWAQSGAGRGDWDQNTPVELTGYLSMEPYPVLRTPAGSDSLRTVLLACDTKCGAQSRLAEFAVDTDRVTIRGTLIERGRHRMLAVSNESGWIAPAPALAVRTAPLDQENLGPVTLRGEILDSKCWFGAMRPNEGPLHKACAMLCIAGGLAPYFYVRDRLGRNQAMMITDPEGGPLIDKILPLVADPVRASGQLVRVEDIVQIRLDPGQVERL